MYLNGGIESRYFYGKLPLPTTTRCFQDLESIFDEELIRSLQSSSFIDNRRSQKEGIKHATQFFCYSRFEDMIILINVYDAQNYIQP